MTHRSILLIGLAVIAVAGVTAAAVLWNTRKPEQVASSEPVPARHLLTDSTIAPIDRMQLLRWAKERPAQAQPKPESLSVTFALEDGNKVTLDYIDTRNYRFTTRNSVFQTYVLDGKIYLYAPADDIQPERIWL